MRKIMAVFAMMGLFLCVTFAASPAMGSSSASGTAVRPLLTATSEPGSVLLQWNQQAGHGVVGFLIRRGTEPDARTMWPLNDYPVAGTSYVDRNVEPGETYYYVIIPLLADGTWGKSSREVPGVAGGMQEGQSAVQPVMNLVGDVRLWTRQGLVNLPLRHAPLFYRGRVLLALEDLVAITGTELRYHPKSQFITHRLPTGRVMEMKIGSDALVFGRATVYDTATPVLQDGQVYLPVRWIIESLEGVVEFDPLYCTVMIQLPEAN